MNNSEYTEAELQLIYDYLSLNVVSEMLLVVGFIIIALLATSTALGWKKTSLSLLMLFGVVTFMIPSGYTMIISPLVALIAVVGLVYEWFIKMPVVSKNGAN